jgi:hypothetical protein
MDELEMEQLDGRRFQSRAKRRAPCRYPLQQHMPGIAPEARLLMSCA